MREPVDPSILWDPNYLVLAYRGRNLSISSLQLGLNELIEDTWARLLALTNNIKIKVELPPLMSEDVRSTSLGDSFIMHAKTEPSTLPFFSLTPLPLLRPHGNPGDDVTFQADPSACQEFYHQVKPIVEAIAFLVHSTGSGPLRLSEVVNDRYRNGSSPRNLLISHGLVFLLRRNLKFSTAQGRRSSVVHFPPKRVVELVVYYLAVIRPIETFLAADLKWADHHAAYSEFLYVVKGRKLAAEHLSQIIARHTERYFKCRLTGLQLRHVLINIQSVFLPPIQDPSVQKFGDSQAGHSTRTANHVYGQRIDHLPGDQAASFVLAYHWCQKLHAVLGVNEGDPPARPIPYIHSPPSPTWWKPSDYIPPNSPSTQEIISRVHFAVNSALSHATQELSTRCEKILRDSVFEAVAALSARPDSNWMGTLQGPHHSTSGVLTIPDIVSFQPAMSFRWLTYL